jgi:membrane-bound ClpP family serine protease
MLAFMPFVLMAAEASAEETSGALLLGAALFLWAVCMGLFLLEFFIPSLGLISVAGALAGLGSVLAAFAYGEVMGWVFLAMNVGGIPAVVTIGFKVLKRSPLIARDEMKAQDVDESSGARLRELIGQHGKATSMLRPAGSARILGRTWSVQTDGEWIENGTQIEVTRVEGNRIYVRTRRSTPTPTGPVDQEKTP